MASAPDLQRHRAFFTVDDVDVDDLRALVDTVTPAERYPNAEAIDREVVVYDMASERSPEQRRDRIAAAVLDGAEPTRPLAVATG